MGASASIVGQIAELPDHVSKEQAQKVLGDNFDEERFTNMSLPDGTVSKKDFIAAIDNTSLNSATEGADNKVDPTDQAGAAQEGLAGSKEEPLKKQEGDLRSAQGIWLCGNPGSGKTFLGDYLNTRGWHHIDGDQGNQSKDPNIQQRWGKLYQAMELHQAGKTQEVTEELWRPYYEILVQQFKQNLEAGKKVVLSFALFNVFGEKSFLESEIPGIKFVLVDVSEDLQIERVLKREAETLKKAGTTMKDIWAEDYMAEYRKRYGEEYTSERWRQMTVDGAKEHVYVKRDENDESIAALINNDDFESFSAIKTLNKLVGLEWEDVDVAKIAAVNMKRMENLNVGM